MKVVLTERDELINLSLPSDIFGSFMFLVNDKDMTFHDKIIDLVYKLMFHGLKTINFNHVSYFALVFAAQMLVLEYYNEHAMLAKMLGFFFDRFMLFYVISSFGLTFESLFESHQTEQSVSSSITYMLRQDLDLEVILTSVNYRIVDLINQVSFCRYRIIKHLMKLKVEERIHQNNPPSKEELKKRFFKIEELGERNLFNLLMMMHKNRDIKHEGIIAYNNMTLFKNYLIGTITNTRFHFHQRI